VWDRCGSARQVVAELAGEGQLLPRRAVSERRVRWVAPDYGSVRDILTNPSYAGTYAFGRSRQVKTVGRDGVVKSSVVKVAIEEWKVCIPDHHPGFVTWEQYLQTQARLRANARPRGEGGGAAREGSALLQGLLRCGKCGRKMMVSYSGIRGRTHVPVLAHSPDAGNPPAVPNNRRPAIGLHGHRSVPGGGQPRRG
jgi:hypothetical protein